MKLDTTAPEQAMSSMAGPSHGKLDSRADPCPQAEDDDSAAKYLFKLSHDVILSLDRIGTILCINQRGVHLSGYSERNCAEPMFLNSSFFPRTGRLPAKCSRT